VPWLRWLLLAINLAVLIFMPEQGRHHLIDVIGAFPVAALALAIPQSRKLTIAVNQLQTERLGIAAKRVFSFRSGTEMLFRSCFRLSPN
jgi:hypothetical protein